MTAGDCRAVLGRSTSEDKVEAIQLTNDHNVREPSELKKLKEAHPSSVYEEKLTLDERDLVKYYDGVPVYVKGMLQLTRCLGDFMLKSKAFIESVPLLHRFERSFNPPYITSTPEVNAFEIGKSDRFIVMASDGVWDELENEAVVNIVNEALNRGHSMESAANLVVEACLAHAASGIECEI